MEAFESMDAKVKQIGALPSKTFTAFLDECCTSQEAVICTLKTLSLVFSLFLMQDNYLRSRIASSFEEPRKGRYNVRVWSHYAEKVLPELLKKSGYICIGYDSDAVVLGLKLSRCPVPIESAEGYEVVLKLPQEQRQGAKSNSISEGSFLSTTPQYW